MVEEGEPKWKGKKRRDGMSLGALKCCGREEKNVEVTNLKEISPVWQSRNSYQIFGNFTS